MLTPIWGVIIDTYYIKSLGKSKTYICIMPIIYSSLLFFLSFHIEEWIEKQKIIILKKKEKYGRIQTMLSRFDIYIAHTSSFSLPGKRNQSNFPNQTYLFQASASTCVYPMNEFSPRFRLRYHNLNTHFKKFAVTTLDSTTEHTL